MRRSEYLDIADRLLAHIANDTTDSGNEVVEIPAIEYSSAVRHLREIDDVFKKLPLMLALSCEIRESGDYKAITVVGVPVLMTRGRDGIVRAFINVCSHRAAGVAPEGVGQCKRFVCPNHGWTYDHQGRLIGLSDRQKFGDIDRSKLNLVELPTEERAGLIFVILTPGLPLYLEHFLGGMLAELESLNMRDWHVYGRAEFASPNWKIASDGYLESYHLAVMHAATIGPSSIGNVTTYDAYGPLPSGPHQRLGLPRQSIKRLLEKPRDAWRTEQGLDCVRAIFPNTILAVRGDGGLVSQIFPGETAQLSQTVQTHFFPSLPQTEAEHADIAERVRLFIYTVRDEDTKYAYETQRGIRSGVLETLKIGKNELGLQRWHASLHHYLDQH